MGVKAELKAARARMQAGEPAEALTMIQQILDGSSPDLQDTQTLYAVLVTAGLAGLASEDLNAAERSFRRASELSPDAPQAWKGLIDCLERGGAGKLQALPECLSRAAEIAEGKGNFSRDRALRVRLGTVLDGLGRKEEALEAVLHHLDNAEASSADGGGDSSSPAVLVEHLSLLLLAAVLEVDKEDAAIAKRVEKRVAKDSGISSSTGAASAGSQTAAGRRSHASALAFEYRAKALAKDAAAAEASSTVGGRLSEAMEALVKAAQQASGGESDGGGGGFMMERPQQEGGGGGSDDAGAISGARREAWKTLVARFCRAYLGRAVQMAETGISSGGGVGGAGGGPSDLTASRWQEVLAACAAVERAVGGSALDEGWAATVTLLASAYAHPNRHQSDRQDGDGDGDAALELRKMAEGGAGDGVGPWLRAEACLHRAGLALRAGDVAEADALLKTASAAAAATRAQLRAPGTLKEGGASSAAGDVSWAGALSGPGSDWRELSLRCLVDERLAGGSAGGPGETTVAAALGLGRVEAAIRAFDESFRLRGAPADGGGYADALGNLGLASASLLLRLGRVEEARASVETASTGATAGGSAGAAAAAGGSEAGGTGVTDGCLCLRHRALCVASEIDLAEGDTEGAKEKLRKVLAADPSSADALSRLGWLLLGFGAGGSASGGGAGGRRCRREDADAAKPLLERAAAKEPGCSSHALRLARCYWEVGGDHRENRSYCFNWLLKAAKLDPSNAEAFEWLGYWYQGVGGDRERARGCFQRSVKLDPSMSGAGEALALLYLENGQETLAVSLFRQCAAVSVACHWAWAGLGRAKILEGKLAEAASHIQQAIRGCPTSWSYWSDLGWCYHAEGKQAAALKAYTRAEELLVEQEPSTVTVAAADGDPDVEGRARTVELAAKVRVRTQVGTIQRQIGQVDEAVSSFQEALSLDPDSSLALEGAGEAYLSQAHARTSEGLYTAAATALRNGCEVTRRFLALLAGASPPTKAAGATEGREGARGECAWKLLGDLHTYAHKLPPMCFEAEGARDGGGGEGGVLGLGSAAAAAQQAALAKDGARNRLEFVAQGAEAYQELVRLLEASGAGGAGEEDGGGEAALARKAAALYDLGLNYLLRARLVCSDAGEGSGLLPQEVYEGLPEVVDLASSAEGAFKRSIEAEPGFSDAWNGLGAVSRDPLVQQHCWVRSVQLEHNPSAWANLGMLYLRWGMDVQAYESFGGLQAVTDHPTMWVGLGLLKEKEACQPGVTPAKRRRLLSQASDAYYSSLETGQHVDGLLGLGTTAGQTHSQADALVALRQHLDLNPNSAQAWNHLGAASELAGRGTQAIAAYRRALKLLEEQGERFNPASASGGAAAAAEAWEEAVRLARVNLGRALVLNGEAEEAVSCLRASGPTQADSLLLLGRAHALLGDWDSALGALNQAGSEGVNGLVSSASARHLRGDEGGAAAAARALMAGHPGDRRALHTVISIAALASDAGLAREASRALQALPKRPSARDADGRLSRQHAAEEDLWAVHLAMRATGAPDSASRRALSKAVHLSPSSVSSWARLGAATGDAAASRAEGTGLGASPPSPHSAGGSGSAAEGGSAASSKLAEACLFAAEKHAMFSLLGKARDAGDGGGRGGGGGSSGGTGGFSAKELATSLSGIAKVAMCGGGAAGKSVEDEVEAGRSRGVRATSRAVHLYPGDALAWRCLATALVGDALSSAAASPGAREAMLGDAQTVYQGVSDPEGGLACPNEDRNSGSLVDAEAKYTEMLLGVTPPGAEDDANSTESFASSLMAARRAALGSVGAGGGDGGLDDAIKRYKLALRAQPGALVAWRELASCYEVSGRHHSSTAALRCGVRAVSPAVDGVDGDGAKQQRGPARAAPLYLQMGAVSLSMPDGQQQEAGLDSVGNAFRVGKGGAAGHVLRGLINSRLGKDGLATSALAKAREAGLEPALAALVDQLAASQGEFVVVE